TIESTFTNAGTFADHRLPVKPSEVEDIARYVAARLGAEGGPGKVPSNVSTEWVNAMIADLRANRGSSIVIAGERQPGIVHALVHGINQALANVGKTLTYSATVEPNPVSHYEDLANLTADMNTGRVDTVLIFGGN